MLRADVPEQCRGLMAVLEEKYNHLICCIVRELWRMMAEICSGLRLA